MCLLTDIKVLLLSIREEVGDVSVGCTWGPRKIGEISCAWELAYTQTSFFYVTIAAEIERKSVVGSLVFAIPRQLAAFCTKMQCSIIMCEALHAKS